MSSELHQMKGRIVKLTKDLNRLRIITLDQEELLYNLTRKVERLEIQLRNLQNQN